MAKVIAICGKLCGGKSCYANQLKAKEKAVCLSCDELSKQLFTEELGEKHDEMMSRIQRYLRNKAIELVKAGCNVILDWGFWTAESRRSITALFAIYDVPVEWHYVEIDDESWKKNIEERNGNVLQGQVQMEYYVDDGLLHKFLRLWETPTVQEIDVWHSVRR